MTTILTSSDTVVLSFESLQNPEPRAVIDTNVGFVNALWRGFVKTGEISRDALRSYYVDYYLTQVNNGGFSQFVYNTDWNPTVVALVREGLTAIAAKQHAALFQKGEWLVAKQPSKLASFLASSFFGKNAERDRFNAITDQFYDLEKAESLESLNAAWLKSRPNLCIVSDDELKEQVRIRTSAIPDRQAREAQARAAEPRSTKLIRALCEAAGQSLQRLTAADPVHQFEGKSVCAFHFLTDKGHHFMLEVSGRAMMFNGATKERVAELYVA